MSFTMANQEDLNTPSFIQFHMLCTSHSDQYYQSSMRDHYFMMLSNRATATNEIAAPQSFEDIIKSASIMLQEWQLQAQTTMNTFKKEYMNIFTYSNNFMGERFYPMNNIVWTSIQAMFNNPSRFTDWINAEGRETNIILNEFNNLLLGQRKLIEEFEQMEQSITLWKQKYPNMVGELAPNTTQMFQTMKQETIDYLALIFIAAFEYVEPEGFTTHDNVLQSYWGVFFDWLEVNRCDRLMNGALNGALFKVNNLEQLRNFLGGDQSHDHLDQIKLNQDPIASAKLISVMPTAANISMLKGKWAFFNEDNLNSVLDINMNGFVEDRIEFDKIRLEETRDCLTTVKKMEGFIGLKEIMLNKQKYLSNTVYYYLIEHFFITVETDTEFQDVQRRRNAIKIIYIFINHILNTEGDKLKELEGDQWQNIIVHIIIRILNGMGTDGDLLDLVKSNVLDEVTENYIYMLFIMITESNDFPKPEDSDELNKGRNNHIVEDDEPDFKIDPQNKRFMYVIRRMYAMAGKKADQQPKYIKRYVNKYYSIDLLRNNEIFKRDEEFYRLELAMNLEFKKGSRQFPVSKKLYATAKTKYLTDTTKNIQGQKHSIPMIQLAKYFAAQINEIPKYKSGDDKKEYAIMFKNKTTKILLGHFNEMKSNFMEHQYVMAIFFACKQFKLPKPDFKYLLENEMEDGDRLNMYEFIKRIMSNLKHNKGREVVNFVDTVDLNPEEYNDQSGIVNGERFRTMILDIENFFKPELLRLSKDLSPTEKSSVEYKDLTRLLKFMDTKFNLVQDSEDSPSADIQNFRLMMTWNIFDDLADYMPLLGDFIEETKGADPNGNNPLKVEIAVENYNSLYLIILEHRLFAASNNFSFADGKDRIENLYAYLEYRNEQYEVMFKTALPPKEIRYSKLSSRQVQNTLYFLRYRMKKVAQGPEKDAILLSHAYYPYSFREIYMLISNHSEIRKSINLECDTVWNKLENEKKMRLRDYTKVSFTEEEKLAAGFKFCVLLAFNRDMVEMIESQARANSGETEHMKTLTTSTIFQELVVPYYDKMTAHELVIQVFNLNMTHAKAAATESIEKFSNYIALLDRFLLILDDLEDGVNNDLVLDNLPKGPVIQPLADFCALLEKSDNPEIKNQNMYFIRHLMFEKLRPGFLAPGQNLREIYSEYTRGESPNQNNITKYTTQIRYGLLPDGMSIDLVPGGEDIDLELLGMLMLYAPHSEFTIELIYQNNFMSALPGHINFAQDSLNTFFRIYDDVSSMNEVFDKAHDRKAKIIDDEDHLVDEEVMNDLNGEYDIDLYLGDPLDDEEIISSHNSFFTEHESVVEKNSLDSNVKKVDQLTKVLVGETVEQIELSSKNSVLSGQVLVIDNMITNDLGESQETSILKSEVDSSLKDSEVMDIRGLNVVSNEQEFAEELLANKNFISTTDKQGKVHTRISDTHESANSAFRKSIAEDRLSANNKCVVKFKVGFNSNISQANLDQLKLLTTKYTKQISPDNYSVKVLKTSTKTSSQANKLVSKRVSHLSEVEENFNIINSEYHIEGVNDVKVSVSENSQKATLKINSTELNSVYADTQKDKLQNKMMDLISKGVMNIVQRSKSLNLPSKSKMMTPIQKKKTSISSKFLRLI